MGGGGAFRTQKNSGTALLLTGEEFSWRSPRLSQIKCTTSAERGSLFQRSVVNEKLVPCMCEGESKFAVTQMFCEKLSQRLADLSFGEDIVMNAAVSEVRVIVTAVGQLAGLSSKVDPQPLEKVMDATSGVSLLVGQTISTVRAYSRRAKDFREHAVAQELHGPKITEVLAELKQTKSVDTVSRVMESLVVWQDTLPEGQSMGRDNMLCA